MVDYSKRKTLKILATSGGAAVVGGTATALTASAAVADSHIKTVPESAGLTYPELASISVDTRLSAIHNDLEIVLTNTGSETVNITQMTPARTIVARGEFNFQKLFENGPVSLKPRQSISVPLHHKPAQVVAHSSVGGQSLVDSLSRSISIVTEGNSFASVSFANMTSPYNARNTGMIS